MIDADLQKQVEQQFATATPRSDLAALVAYQSIADGAHKDGCDAAAKWIIKHFTDAGLVDVKRYPADSGKNGTVIGTGLSRDKKTVLLYCHYDVQPEGKGWDQDDPFHLTDKNGRWYGRGSADCKGNVIAHLAALRAFKRHFPVGVILVAEGSEEQSDGQLEQLVKAQPELFKADAILICDTGNVAVGQPTLTTSLRGVVTVKVTVTTLKANMHSGGYGGPAPDALQALIHMLANVRGKDGVTTVAGLDNQKHWPACTYSATDFHRDAQVLDTVHLVDAVGDPKHTVCDMLWAQPALTVLNIRCPDIDWPAAGKLPAHVMPRQAEAWLNLRIAPGVTAQRALELLKKQLDAAAPWNAQVEVHDKVDKDNVLALGDPFSSSIDRNKPAFATLHGALLEAYGKQTGDDLHYVGQGGSIPLCNVFHEKFPDAEIMLMGVEEPQCLIHAANESVDPSEIKHMAVAEALFLRAYAAR